ncbi:MAG: polysaccharide deacetylase family protein [Phycisphaerae bacterium]|nr:polysaccharide deacetylase family protein [Phycisphaerae bacterium]
MLDLANAPELRRKVFAALSWRVEARATGMSPRRGQSIRRGCGRFMEWAGAHRSLPNIPYRAAILCFHNVIAHRRDPEIEEEALELPQFRRLLRVLRDAFQVISLAELVAAIRERRSPPPRSIVISFDDGYATNHTVVAEELAALGMPWSAFLPAQIIETGARQWTDDLYLLIHRGSLRHLRLPWSDGPTEFDLHTVQQRREALHAIRESCRYLPEGLRRIRLDGIYGLYSQDEIDALRARYPAFAPMTWEQARELKAAGVDVGSHGLTHVALAPQTPQAIRHEITGARDLIQARIGEHSRHFSYPYGRQASISQDTRIILTALGYHCALTLEQSTVDTRTQNLMELPRLIAPPSAGRTLFNLWQRFIR